MRKFILIVLLGIALMPLEALGKDDGDGLSVMLRQSVKVDDAVIRLGDLFTQTGEQADVAIAYAPEPGKRASFDARWLYRVARAYRLKWRPINDRMRAVVVRTSQVISREEIVETLRGALTDKGTDGDMEIELSNKFLKLHVPGDSLSGIAVDDIDYHPRSRRFTAILSAPADSPQAKQFRITGRLHKTVEVPVLNRRVLAGEIIKRQDVKWTKVRARRVPPNTIVNESDIVGKSPRRGLRAGYPVLLSAVRRPVLVAKGSLVTMYLQAPKMMLTAQGKALEDGSDGDVIRITNTQSNKVVEAEIIGHGKAAVRPTALVAMN